MKKIYCFICFCSNLFFQNNKKSYILKKYNIKYKIYNEEKDNYNILERYRNNEYENILDEIFNEYEEKIKNENKKNKHIKNIEIKLKKEKYEKNNENDKYDDNNKNDDNDVKQINNEIKKHNEYKKKTLLLNMCNLNYDLLNKVLENKLHDENEINSGNFNKISLFAESEINENKNLCIDDSIERYLMNIDESIINSISEKELHYLKNEVYRYIIYLKYKYMKSYKDLIRELKNKKKKKTEEINKYVSIVHEDENDNNINNENINDIKNKDLNKLNFNNIDKNNISISNIKDGEIENYNKITEENLSIENFKYINNMNEKIYILEKNYEQLKGFNIFNTLNNNIFFNNIKKENFFFLNYTCSILNQSINTFLKKLNLKNKNVNNENVNKNDILNKNENEIYQKSLYICLPKINDPISFHNQTNSIIIKLFDQYEEMKKINDLNIQMKKGIIILSNHLELYDVSVKNLCDKISYLTQNFVLLYNINTDVKKKKMYRLLILMLFYFNIKNIYIICLDNESSEFFYNFLINMENNLLSNYSYVNKNESLFIDLNEMKFDHVFNKNFIPLFNIKYIFQNFIFFFNDDSYFKNNINLNVFKKSCLFIFLTKENDKSQVLSAYVQHFLYYKKYPYSFIYEIDQNFSLETLKNFNEILIYLTSWFDIFQTVHEEKEYTQLEKDIKEKEENIIDDDYENNMDNDNDNEENIIDEDENN